MKVLENNNKKFARNRSAKKEFEKRKMDEFAFKRKDGSMNPRKEEREKTLEKNKQPFELGLKGLNLKMNVRKKK